MADFKVTGSTIGELVPQLFYDIIARLIPGFMICGLLVFTVIGPKQSWSSLSIWLNKPSESYPSIFIFIIVSIVFSYTLAIVFRGLWFLLSLCADRGTYLSEKYDFIKLTNPTIGNRISKLRAEVNMTKILIMGFSLSFLINLSKPFCSPDDSRMIFAVVLLLAIAGSVGAIIHFSCLLKRAINNYAKLLGYKNTNKEVNENLGEITKRNIKNDGDKNRGNAVRGH